MKSISSSCARVGPSIFRLHKADDAHGLLVLNRNKPATRLVFDSHFGDDRDPYPGLDHVKNRQETAALKSDARLDLGPLEHCSHVFAEAVPVFQRQKRFPVSCASVTDFCRARVCVSQTTAYSRSRRSSVHSSPFGE